MKSNSRMLLVSIASLVLSVRGFAGTPLSATLTPGQETTAPTFTTSTGDPRVASFGNAAFELNSAKDALSFTATIFNIDVTGTQTPDPNDDLVAAHIHAAAIPGQNASVRWGFFGSPDNDNNPDNLVVTPFATGVGGTFSSIWNEPEGNNGTTLSAQLPNILGGLAYINFHTRQNPGGEIRGQIRVPDSGGGVMLAGMSLTALLALRRRMAAVG